MSKNYSPKVERQIIRRIINQGLLEDNNEKDAQAQIDEQYERFLEREAQKALRKKKRGRNKDWDDN